MYVFNGLPQDQCDGIGGYCACGFGTNTASRRLRRGHSQTQRHAVAALAPNRGSLQLIGNLVDASLRADIVLAGRTGNANRADHLVADLNRQAAAQR